mmetsp:Transcript_11366/g.18615  ORF Transcript_11366/g.18615 Transcript_11366/m.18615 type:complete len:328 (-) Transcript_11366:275-1258(-)
MGAAFGAENSTRVRNESKSFQKLMDDVKDTNERLADLFIDPQEQRRLRFELYSRLALGELDQYWSWFGNVLIMTHIIPSNTEGNQQQQKRHILTINQFYYIRLKMMESSKLLEKLSQDSSSLSSEAKQSSSKLKRQASPSAAAASASDGKRKSSRHKSRRFRWRTSVYYNVDVQHGNKNKLSSSSRSRDTCFVKSLPLFIKSPDKKENLKAGGGEEEREDESSGNVEQQPPQLEKVQSAELCSICFDMPSDVVLPCMHAFCEGCITEWNVKNNTCPICRKQIEAKDLEKTWVLTNETDNEFSGMAKEEIKFIFKYIEGKVQLRSAKQ